MESLSEESFEYTDLDDRTKTLIWQYTVEIKDLMRLTAENIIDIGLKLTQVKLKLGHGSFQKWLRTEFEWSEQTARQFMQVYRWSETIENKKLVFSKLGTSALYLIAAPSTPPEAREEVLDLVDGGEKVSYTRAKSIINRYKKLPPAIDDDNVTETVDTEKKSEIQPKSKKAGNLLFRLETPELGCIVKLYRADELKVITNLNIGAIVKIKVGRWQNRTAKIIEVLNEPQLAIQDSQEASSTLTALSNLEMNICVDVIERLDFSDRQTFPEIDRHLMISYGDTYLAVKANSEILIAFIQQVKTDPEYIKDIFQQVIIRLQKCAY